MQVTRLELAIYCFIIPVSLLFAFCMGPLVTDMCHGTSVGDNLPKRICHNEAWSFLPLGIDVALLALLPLVVRHFAVPRGGRLVIVVLYCLYVVVSAFVILELPFFYEYLCGEPGQPECR